MKIAIAGSAGSGKTTLAKALAARLEFVYIAENYEAFFDQPGKFNSPPHLLSRAFIEVLEKKRTLELQAGSFVADRCPVDLFHLWLRKNLFQLEEETRQYYDQCQAYCRDYDFIILSAWGCLDLTPLPDKASPQKRVMNPWVQLSNHASISGLASMWLPAERIIHLPQQKATVAKNVQMVLEAIKKRR